MNKLKFFSLASSSSGNCYYIGAAGYGLLIDAGIGVRMIVKILKDKNVDFEKILAVLVTHDHGDHIKAIGSLGEHHHIPIYATEAVHLGLDRTRYVTETLTDSRRIIEIGTSFKIRDFWIEAFAVPHDSSENVGYSIEYGGCRFAIATDVGHVTDTISHHLKLAQHIVLEANYDEVMLQSGSYPAFLKVRVSGDMGHLSNSDAAQFLAENYVDTWQNVWLCHLSRENNRPDVAYKAVSQRLEAIGVTLGDNLHLHVLKRMSPSDIFELQ
jgi:phosphoribosyl 1,2-cyclic phosphodiesterase